MPEVPPEVDRLVREREERRAARDFEAADDLRRRVRELGFDIEDGPSGPRVTPAAATVTPLRRATADRVPSALGEPPSADFTVQWLVQGWPEDVLRGIGAFRRHQGE